MKDSETVSAGDGAILAYFSKSGFEGNNLMSPGSVIQFEGEINRIPSPKYPLQFDYGRYLSIKGYAGTIYLPDGKYVLEKERYFSLRAFANQLRSAILAEIEAYNVSEHEFGVLAALLLGERSFLDVELRDDFADAGAIHILAVSGLHVGIIYFFFISLLNKLSGKRRGIWKLLPVLIILWGYAVVTGLSPSVLRASTMFSFIALGKCFDRYGNIYNLIAASALILLTLKPVLILQPGFALSYLAVLGIVFYYPRFRSIINLKNKWLDKVASLICVSLAAQLATFPISIYYFHQFPNLFLLTNLIVIPLATIILYSGILWMAFIWLDPVAIYLGEIVFGACRILNGFVSWISGLPHAKLSGLFLEPFEVVLIYGLILSITAFTLHPIRISLRLAGSFAVLIVISVQGRKIANHGVAECFLTNLKENPTLVFINAGAALAFSNDTAQMRSFLNRELETFLFSKGVKSDDIELFQVSDSLIIQSDFLNVVKPSNSVELCHLAWKTGRNPALIHANTDGITTELSYGDTLSYIRMKKDEFTPFSIDRLLPEESPPR